MCVETKKIIRSRDVVFDEDSTSISHGVEISPSGSCETPTLALVDEPSKPTPSNDCNDDDLKIEKLVNDGEDEVPTPTLTPYKGKDKGSTQEPRYPRRE